MENTNNNGKTGIFITGSNQYIGIKLVMELLKNNQAILFCFNHSLDENAEDIFYNTLEDNLKCSALSQGEIDEKIKRVVFIPGHIDKPMLGITHSNMEVLENTNIERIWHTLEFIEHDEFYTEKVNKYNVNLTKELVKLAKHLKVSDFNFISSAFLDTPIDEERKNIYFESKKNAEQILLSSSKTGEFSLRIFRTSIVIDTSARFECYFSYFLQRLGRFLEFINDREDKYFSFQALTILRKGEMNINLIPVDMMVNKAIEISKKECGTSQIYYIYSRVSLALEDIGFALREKYPDLQIRLTEKIEELNPIDKMFYEKIEHFYAFFANDFCSECSEKGSLNIELEFSKDKIKEFIKQYLICRLEEDNRIEDHSDYIFQQMKKTTIMCRFGQKLEYYSIGKGDALIINGALGLNISMWKKVISFLSQYYRVIIWEPRGLKEEHYPSHDSDLVFSFEQRSNDIKDILDHEDIKDCHILGWCSGTKEALNFYFKNPERVKSLILVAGDYTNQVERKTLLIEDIKNMAEVLNREPKTAPVFIKVLSKIPKVRIDESPVSDEASQKIIHMINPKHFNLIREGILNTESLIYYCKRIDADNCFECADNIHEVRIPTLVVAAQFDSVSNPCQSQWLYSNVKNAQFIELKAAIHYIPLEHYSELNKAVFYFLSNI